MSSWTAEEAWAWTARQRRDSSSKASQPVEAVQEELSRCRLTVVHRRKDDPSKGRAVQVQCKQKRCPDCGPEYRRRKVAHYVKRLADAGPIYRAEVTAQEWATMRKRLSGKAPYVRVPAAEDRFVVLTTATLGEPVTDIGEAVTSAFAEMAVDRRSVSCSRDWKEPHEEKAEKSEWEQVGVTLIPVREIARTFANFDLLGTRLESTTAEGWNVVLPHRGHELWQHVDLHRQGSRFRADPPELRAALRAA